MYEMRREEAMTRIALALEQIADVDEREARDESSDAQRAREAWAERARRVQERWPESAFER